MLKRLVNQTEELVGERIGAVCEKFGACVYAKIRIADVCEIARSGITDEEFRFALQAHFDFVVANREHMPLFVVEFDGPTHESPAQQRRDQIKDHLCERFELPLLRCRNAHLQSVHDGWDLLSWIVDVWFMRDATCRMREEGQLPPDFDFDPASVMSAPGHRRRFPYWLGLDAQLELQHLHEQGRLIDRVPRAIYLGVDDRKVLRAYAFLRIDAKACVRASVAMRSQRFPMDYDEMMTGMLINSLHREVQEVFAGRSAGVSVQMADAELQELIQQTTMLSSFGSADREP